nr:hypothetical protein [uncultured Aquimarina sp.]
MKKSFATESNLAPKKLLHSEQIISFECNFPFKEFKMICSSELSKSFVQKKHFISYIFFSSGGLCNYWQRDCV